MSSPEIIPNPSLPRNIPPLQVLDPPTKNKNNNNNISTLLGTFPPTLDPLPTIPTSPAAASSTQGSNNSNNKNRVLLIIPTANKSKTALLTDHLRSHLPGCRSDGAAAAAAAGLLETLTLPATSNVGEQPYDYNGPLGAYNRIKNALALFISSSSSVPEKNNQIGTVIIGAVENFILREYPAPDRATDFGVVMLYNASTGQLSTGISRGMEVPAEYWKAAEGYGFDDDDEDEDDDDHDEEEKEKKKKKERKDASTNTTTDNKTTNTTAAATERTKKKKKTGAKGKVTVGEVLAANIPGLDKADWHKALSAGGVSRYDLLREALEEVGVPGFSS